MFSLLNYTTLLLAVLPLSFTTAQSTNSTGYTGYNLTLSDDEESVTYATDDTIPNVSVNTPEPDVYLNASVHIGEIDILVQNLTAKINVDAQVLNLLTFNAGVDLSIDRVSLTIQNVTAKVLLEARLENLDVTTIVNSTVRILDTITSSLMKRSTYELLHNILYSTNDYSGNTHRNRILDQNGDIVDLSLDNDGTVKSKTVVGSYLSDMTFNGDNVTTTLNGVTAQKLEYCYEPFRGLSVVSFVWIGSTGQVLKTQVLSEAFAGGESTIGDDL